MSAFGLGAFRATLGLDSSDYTKSIVSAGTATNTFGQTITTAMVNPLLGAVSGLKQVATASLRFAQQVLGDAEAIQRLADTTGVAAETIQALRQEADLAHGSMQIATGAVSALANAVGEARQGFGRGGPMLEQLIGDVDQYRDIDEILRAVTNRLLELPVSERGRLAQVIFGGSGADFLNTIEASGTSIDGLIGKYERLGLVTRRDVIDSLADLNTGLGTTQKAFAGLQLSLATEFLAGFAGNVDSTNASLVDLIAALKDELSPVARDLGTSIGSAVREMQELIKETRALIDLFDTLAMGKVGRSGRRAFDDFRFGGGSFTEVDFNSQGAPVRGRTRNRFDVAFGGMAAGFELGGFN